MSNNLLNKMKDDIRKIINEKLEECDSINDMINNGFMYDLGCPSHHGLKDINDTIDDKAFFCEDITCYECWRSAIKEI